MLKTKYNEIRRYIRDNKLKLKQRDHFKHVMNRFNISPEVLRRAFVQVDELPKNREKEFVNWTDAKVEELKSLLELKLTSSEILKFYGFSKQRLQQLIRKYNLPAPYKKWEKTFDRDFQKRFREDYNAGIRQRDLCEKYQLHPRDIQNLISRLGLVPRKGRFIDFRERKVQELLRYAKYRSSKDSDIEFEDLLPLPTHCPILGIELSYEGLNLINGVSIDQIYPGKGYVKGNVCLMSIRANRLKNDGTALEHELIAKFMRQPLPPL